MDYDDMEQKISDNHIHAAIFCSPHNPCGRVWEREEIERAMAIYEKYHVEVVADEIWSDIILETISLCRHRVFRNMRECIQLRCMHLQKRLILQVL